MLLADVENATRQDLFDTGATRWANSDIDRAIDKAVDRYSQYYPNIVYSDMLAQPFQRTYPYPQPWNASYPVWWIERIYYPLQAYGSYFTPPTSGMTATAAQVAALILVSTSTPSPSIARRRNNALSGGNGDNDNGQSAGEPGEYSHWGDATFNTRCGNKYRDRAQPVPHNRWRHAIVTAGNSDRQCDNDLCRYSR